MTRLLNFCRDETPRVKQADRVRIARPKTQGRLVRTITATRYDNAEREMAQKQVVPKTKNTFWPFQKGQTRQRSPQLVTLTSSIVQLRSVIRPFSRS